MSDSSGKLPRRERLKQLFRGRSPRPETAALAPAKPPTASQAVNPSTSSSSQVGTLSDENTGIESARNQLWKSAFENLKKEQPELVQLYELLLKEDAGTDQNADISTREVTAAVVKKQQTRMESRQWTYSWFGKPRKVRDTAESILTTIERVSGLASVGMSSAPPFVSLAWSMSTSLIAFVMNDFDAVNSAIDGLKEVTGVLANYSYVEQEFLRSEETRKDFEDIVLGLYTAIYEYQARAAQYFARNTLKRLGVNTLTAQSWPEAVEKVRNLEQSCQTSIGALGVRLGQKRFGSVEALLSQGMRLMEQIGHAVTSERAQREKILDWISPINYFADHSDVRKILGDAYLGSGRWLLQDEVEFQPWRRSENDILFLQGVVGSGKTSLTSIVIQGLLEKEAVAFFYCSANASSRDASRTAHNETFNILQSILAQCSIRADGTIAEQIRTAFERSDRQSPGGCDMTLGVVMSTLKDVLQERADEQITLVFDALDECLNQGEFLSCLADLMKSQPKLRAFVSTRFGVDFAQYFENYRALSVGVQNSDDISAYVDGEISKRRGNRMTLDQAERLKEAIIKYADGVFRWVELELNIFLPKTQRQGFRVMSADIDRRLLQLENSQAPAVDRLFDAYEELYKYSLGEEDEIARRFVVKAAIKWVLCSFTQLYTASLSRAVSILPDGTKAEDLTAEDILAYCSNFLVKASDNSIKLAHLSVRQFFEERRADDFSPPLQHLQVAQTCLQFVRSFFLVEDQGSVHSSITRRPEVRYYLRLRSCLVDDGKVGSNFNYYPYLYWSMHCRAADKSEDLMKNLKSPGVRDVLFPDLDFLHRSIAEGADLKSQDTNGNTILHRTVLNNNIPALGLLLRVETLLEHSGVLNTKNRAGDLAIHIAAMMGCEMAFHDLIQAGSDTDTMNLVGLTPFEIAVMLGRDPIVERIGHIQPLTTDDEGNSILHYASFFNADEAVRILIRAGWSRSLQNNQGNSPLHLAAIGGSSLAYNTLLSAGASNSIRNKKNQLAQEILDLSRYSDASIVGFTSRQPSRIGSGPLERPPIVLEDTTITSCKFCDLNTWLKESQVHTYLPSLERLLHVSQLIRAKQLVCRLCAFLEPILFRMVSEVSIGQVEEVRVRIRLDVDSGGLKTGKDVLEISFADVFHEIEICLDAGEAISPLAADLFHGRSVKQEATETHVVNQIRQWSDICCGHAVCRLSHTDSFEEDYEDRCEDDTQSGFPTYLVDVGHGSEEVRPRIVGHEELTKTSDRRFVFLSAKWGSTQFFHAKTSTIEELKRGVSLDRLPASQQDAIRVCRRLGYRYLWVDALCVVMDDPEVHGFEEEMIPIYSKAADLVLVGTNTMTDSLIPIRKPGGTLSISASLRTELSAASETFTLQLRESLPDATKAIHDNVLDRAWRLREVVLPRRFVLFDPQQLIWSCCEMSKSEGSALALAPWFKPFRAIHLQLEHLLDRGQSERDEYLPVIKAEIFSWWYSIVEMASKGALASGTRNLVPPVSRATHLGLSPRKGPQAYSLNERLETVHSIAWTVLQLLNKLNANGWDTAYVAGLWLGDIRKGLLWISAQPYRTMRSNRPGSNPYGHDTSTWSWAHSRAPISYCLSKGLKIELAIEGGLEVGQAVYGPWIVLPVTALTRQLSELATDDQHFEYFWDAVDPPGSQVDARSPDVPFQDDSEDEHRGNEDGSAADGRSNTPDSRKSAEDPRQSHSETYADRMTSGLGACTLALVAPWTFRPSMEPCDARWAGLIVKRRPDLDRIPRPLAGRDAGVFVRKGVFLGPLCHKDLSGWERKMMALV